MNDKFKNYRKEFTLKAEISGFSAENITRCLSYAEPLISKDLPVIYNTSHLSALVGYKKSYINRAIAYPRYFYRYFEILKKDGNKRQISEPLPSLKEIQHWILNEILYNIKVSRYAKAYTHKRSIKDHVKYHTKSSMILTLDIYKFFDSIKPALTESMFKQIGYSNLVSNILMKLCYLNDSLPQGAPTSPYISNILLYGFDENLSEYCRDNDLKYTRYADDLAFSGKIKKVELIQFISIELEKIGLRLNNNKTRLMKPNQPQIISGLVVNDKIQVPKSHRNKIRNEMFYIKKFTLENHLKKTSQTKNNYLKHLIGKINYTLTMNPKDNEFIEYKKYLYKLEMPAGNKGYKK